jgi:branched-chain amino acid transport system ATP-binding protein
LIVKPNLLELDNIHTYYSESHVIRGLSLKVGESAAAALLGRNGMGKTTTIRSIIGFTPPRTGAVMYRGENISGIVPNRISQMGIGLVPQGRRIFPSLSVKENILLAERNRGKSDPWTLERVYSLFPILEKRAAIKGTKLSGGEQQMLAIVRALMTNPDLLLMDEPSEGLAPIIVQEVGKIMNDIKTQDVSILIVEQNLPLALGVADYAYIISIGEIVYESGVEELYRNEEIKARYLGVSN